MYCPTCGADLPEGSSFCTTCGTALEQSNYVETPEPAVKPKSRFSVLRLISLLLTLVCIGLLSGSYFTIINTSFEDIAFISFAAEIAGDDMDELDNMEDELELVLRDFRETVPGSRERIRDVLRVMVIAERASHLTRRAEELMPKFSN